MRRKLNLEQLRYLTFDYHFFKDLLFENFGWYPFTEVPILSEGHSVFSMKSFFVFSGTNFRETGYFQHHLNLNSISQV